MNVGKYCRCIFYYVSVNCPNLDMPWYAYNPDSSSWWRLNPHCLVHSFISHADKAEMGWVIFRIWDSQNSKHELCHLPRYSTVWSVCEPTFRRNVSPSTSGSKISQAKKQRAVGAQVEFWYVLPKLRFTYGLHGAISQKMATFEVILTNSVALVRERTTPTQRPPLVGEVALPVRCELNLCMLCRRK
jgi:hypothetical protein